MAITKDEQLALNSDIQAYLLVHALLASLQEAKVISDRRALKIIERGYRRPAC
jgi:hypothetical protein